jgi:hypothetical protein
METEQLEFRADWTGVPEHLRGGLDRYIVHGIKPGDFLTAFLSNDLMETLGRADDKSRAGFFGLASFLYNEAPSGCFRSPENVARWIAEGGLRGRAAA